MTRERQAAGVVAGFVVGFAVGWNTTNTGAIASTMAGSYGIGLASVGLFTTALFLTHLASQIPGGRLVDRYGARRICLVGVATMACGTAASMIAPVPALAIGARALTGLGTGTGFIAATAYVRRSGGSALAQGLFGGITLGAAGVAIAVVPQLTSSLSWRAPYATALALAMVALIWLMTGPADHGGELAATARSPARLLSDTKLYPVAFVYAATYGTGLVLSNWVVELLERRGTGAQANLIGALILVLVVVTRPLGGWIVRAHGARVRLAVGLSLVAGGLGTALLVVGNSAPAAIAGCTLLGIGSGISFSPAFTGAAALHPEAPAAAVGLVNSAGAAAVLVCTPLLGLTFSLPGDGRLGFAVATAVWFVALLVLPDRRALGGGLADPSPPAALSRDAARG